MRSGEKMRLLIFVCVALQASQSLAATKKILHGKYFHPRHARQIQDNTTLDMEEPMEARALTGSVSILPTKYKFIVAVRDATMLLGPGVVVTAKWFVCHPDVVGSKVATEILMYANLADGSAPTGNKHRGKQILQYTPARNVLQNAITLVRFCPEYTTGIYAFPAAAPTFTFETAVSYVNYAPALKEVSRKMGITCQCAGYATYTDTQHFCLDEEITNFLDVSTDPTVTTKDRPGSVCMMGSDVIGLNVGVQNKGGEPYLELYKFKSWISTNAV